MVKYSFSEVEVVHMREELGRIRRLAEMYKNGNTKNKLTGECRIDIIRHTAKELDNMCKEVKPTGENK